MDQDCSRFGRLEAHVRRLEQRVTKLEYDACTNFGSCVIDNETEQEADSYRAK